MRPLFLLFYFINFICSIFYDFSSPLPPLSSFEFAWFFFLIYSLFLLFWKLNTIFCLIKVAIEVTIVRTVSTVVTLTAWQYILYYNSFLASVDLGMGREGEGCLRSFSPLLQLLVIWALIGESTSIQSSGNIPLWLRNAFWDLGPEAGLFSGLCLSSWDARSTRGQLSWGCWLPSGCLGSLTGMEVLFYTKKCWGCGQRGVSKDSCSVSGFWGIPWWAWQGISSFQHCREAATSWLGLE